MCLIFVVLCASETANMFQFIVGINWLKNITSWYFLSDACKHMRSPSAISWCWSWIDTREYQQVRCLEKNKLHCFIIKVYRKQRDINFSLQTTVYYTHIHLRLVKVFITHKLNIIRKWNKHVDWSTTPAESQKALEAHGCKHWVTNLSIVLHALSTCTAHRNFKNSCVQIFLC